MPVRVGADADWATPVCGGDHTLALKTDGSLWAWGANDDGQLGLGDEAQRTVPARVGSATDWAAVSAGEAHTAALRADGTLWTWGANDDGQLGLGDDADRAAPAQVGDGTGWVAVACGSHETFALKQDGSSGAGVATTTANSVTATLGADVPREGRRPAALGRGRLARRAHARAQGTTAASGRGA